MSGHCPTGPVTRRMARLARARGVLLQAVLAVLLLAGCAAAPVVPAVPAAPAVLARTVYLVRHAEKGAQPAADPPLTAAGEARALALAGVLADAGVRSIITTHLLRTRDTGRPLAERLGITPQLLRVAGPAADHARAVADAVRAMPAGAVLVVGHSNTVPLIIAALGGPKLPDICDAAYANLFVLQLAPDGTATLARTEYGARSGASAECPGMAP